LLRDVARKLSYRTGALSLYHRVRNRQVLTDAMFHRILKRDDPRWKTALHSWTLPDDVFDECLTFFKRRRYALVKLDDVKASLEGTRRLPPRSLLITFDDGYARQIRHSLVDWILPSQNLGRSAKYKKFKLAWLRPMLTTVVDIAPSRSPAYL
jgi:hypothetical protein